MKNTVVINILGGPGAGKSTAAAKLFGILKERNYDVELIPEFSKELVWENNMEPFNDRVYMHAMQNHFMFNKIGKVEYMIVDSPLLLTKVYYDYYLKEKFTQGYTDMMDCLVKETIHLYNNRNYYLIRETDYQDNGRRESEETSLAIDAMVIEYLEKNKMNYKKCNLDNIISVIMEDIESEESK